MYRLVQTDPENSIDPAEQVSFYDPDIGATAPTAPVRFVEKLLST